MHAAIGTGGRAPLSVGYAPVVPLTKFALLAYGLQRLLNAIKHALVHWMIEYAALGEPSEFNFASSLPCEAK